MTLRRRGIATREFRVDDYGAPRYPELVLAVRRSTLEEHPALVEDMLGAIAEGTDTALRDRGDTVDKLVRASGADAPLVRAELTAVAPALQPPVELDLAALEAWAPFDARFGILRHQPDVSQAFFVR